MSASRNTPGSAFQRAGLTRRQMLGVSGTVGLGVLLAACASPGTTRIADTTLRTDGPAEGHVSFAHWRGEDRDVFDELIAQFRETYPQIEVTQDISTSSDYGAQALRRIRDGAVGDVAPAMRGAQFQSFLTVGQFVDLTESSLPDMYEPKLIEVGYENGNQYGFPYQVVFNVPIANMDILDSVGYSEPPANWDQYLDMLDKIKSQGVTPLLFPGADAGNAGQLMNSMAMNLGPTHDMMAKIETGEFKCTDDWFIEMLYKYQELGPFTQDNAGGTAVEPAQQMFATGRGAILATGSYHIASVRSLGAEFPIDLVPAMTNGPDQEPKYVGIYNATFILGINSASKVQPAAYKWIEFLSQPEVASFYGDGTAQHTTVAGAVYTDPDLVRLQPWLDENLLLAPRFQFLDLDMRNAVEASGLAAMTGTSPEQAAENAQVIVDQRIAAAE